MPLFLGSIRKDRVPADLRGGWVNTYHLDAANESAALTILQQILTIERAVHWDNILFTRLSVRLAGPISNSGRQLSVQVVGDRVVGTEQFLPTFNTARIILTDSINRPDQKYLRLPIAESESDNGLFAAGFVTLITDEYITPLLALAGVVSSSDTTYTSGALHPVVQMRQRSWHRRSRPGEKRGWVPA